MPRNKFKNKEPAISTPFTYVPDKDEPGTQRIPWLRLRMEVDMVHKDGTGISYMERKIYSSYRLIHHEKTSADLYYTYSSPINDFEAWVRGFDLSGYEPQGRKDRIPDRRNLLGRVKGFWRKFFFKGFDFKK